MDGSYDEQIVQIETCAEHLALVMNREYHVTFASEGEASNWYTSSNPDI